MRCPFCGSNLEKNAKYCNDCGTAVDSECSGKNINYRSYTDTRPNANNIPKTPSYRIRENKPAPNYTDSQNPFRDKQAQFKKPPVSVLPSTTYSMSNVNTVRGNKAVKKKSGCGIAVVVIIILFTLFSVIGAFLGEEVDDIFDDDNYSFYEQDGEFYDSDYQDDAVEPINGRFDGAYYLNDFVNIAFKVPDAFEDKTEVFEDSDLDCVLQDGGNMIVTGYEYESDPSSFIERFKTLVLEDIKKSDVYNGSNINTSTITEKEVGGNTFYGMTISCGDLDGECRIIDFYTTVVDDYAFYIKISSSSPELNKSIIDSFVLAHTE